MRKEEYQPLNESEEWVTIECLIACDSSLFLRIEEWDNVTRLHLFMRKHKDSDYIFNGRMDWQGSCHNQFFAFATPSEHPITIWISSFYCNRGTGEDCCITFPAYYDSYLPKELNDTTIYCQKAVWRDVKKWW